MKSLKKQGADQFYEIKLKRGLSLVYWFTGLKLDSLGVSVLLWTSMYRNLVAGAGFEPMTFELRACWFRLNTWPRDFHWRKPVNG